MSELIAAYSIDVHANPDFFWVFVTRVFYYMGISLQVHTHPLRVPHPLLSLVFFWRRPARRLHCGGERAGSH